MAGADSHLALLLTLRGRVHRLLIVFIVEAQRVSRDALAVILMHDALRVVHLAGL